MNQFTEKYKNLKNTELLTIIENADDYQILAVEAAKQEIENRQLSEKELSDAKGELNTKQIEQDAQKEKNTEIENKLKNIALSAVKFINPVQHNAPTTSRLINLISIVFGFNILYLVIDQFEMLEYAFAYGADEWIFVTTYYILPIVFLSGTVFLFWKRKKIGWIFLCVFLSYVSISTISSLSLALISDRSASDLLDSLFPETPIISYILRLVFYVGVLWVINKESVRAVYNIKKQVAYITLGVILVISIFIIVL